MRNNRGFTLIELSIVLVIIGLIVGGVLVGRDMIKVAEIRSQVRQFEQLESAVNTFKLKYNCYPGACSNGVSLGLAANNPWTPGANGAMLRCLDLSPTDCPQQVGVSVFFLDLTAAGLIADKQVLYPVINVGTGGIRAKLSGNAMLIQNDQDAQNLAYLILSGMNTASCGDYCANLTTFDAYTLDSKMDDGLPLSGKVRGDGEFTDYASRTPTSTGAAGSAVCINTDVTPNAYNLTYTGTEACQILKEIIRY